MRTRAIKDNSEKVFKLSPDEEKKEILSRYRDLLRAGKQYISSAEDIKSVRTAFDLALDLHKEMRRRSGEPYIFHPLAVAKIAAEEIGLGTTSIICALLHDTVEDTDYTIEKVNEKFGEKVATIIDGLTKIEGVFDQSSSLQAENFRKMLLTMSDDVRVILIKLADRLHNMRTLDAMPRKKQLKIASETAYLYAPLAHRLGLYAIKTEMDDLVLKYTEPDAYRMIASKLIETKKERDKFIAEFISPLVEELNEQGFVFDIKGRPKSINSIWSKMKKQEVTFEQIYDLFAVRIIVDTPLEKEKADCWQVYSIVTDFYVPNPDRLRDWVSVPKSNGYESLHTTVMSTSGKWVEVQIRTKRMDEVAEKGYAAHWKYKESTSDGALDEWVTTVRELLQNPESSALDFIDDFKLNLFSDEIFVFTPKGELRTLPVNSTALDFAFDIHSDIGCKCIGAKISNKLLPISHTLKSGDQVEILTSGKQSPKDDWLGFVITAKAKSKIKNALKEEKREIAGRGKEIFQRKLRSARKKLENINMNELVAHFRAPSILDFYYRIGKGTLDIGSLKDYFGRNKNAKTAAEPKPEQSFDDIVKKFRGSAETLVIGENMERIDYKLAPCCSPIPGDDVFGFITINDGIKIHRTNCPNAVLLMSNYDYRIVKARWTGQKEIAFLAGIRVEGIDEVGVVQNITQIISSELQVNIRSISFESKEGIFEGRIMLYVNDTEHLDELISKLNQVEGITSTSRIDTSE